MNAIWLFAAISTQPAAFPPMPIGANAAFHEAVAAVRAAAVAGDYDKATRLLDRLPKLQLKIAWIDSNVAEARRTEYAVARDGAIRNWEERFRPLTVTTGASPDITFSFEPKLAEGTTAGLPAGLVTFFNPVGPAPRLEAVIGLARGAQGQATSPVEVANEVRYAIGAYLGVTGNPLFGPAMGRTDLPTATSTSLSASELLTAQQIQRFVAALTAAVKSRAPIPPFEAEAFIDPVTLNLGRVTQGERIPISIQVSNRGNAPLRASIVPDCGCFRVEGDATIAPGSTKLMRVWMDTREFVGRVNKRLALFTNDAKMASREIPVTVDIEPRYRFLTPGGDVKIVDTPNVSLETFLCFSADAEAIPTGVRVEGAPATATIEPWTGSLPDPKLGEEARPREGYRITIKLQKSLANGRIPASVVVTTSDPVFDVLRTTLYLQRGIVALPQLIYLGHVSGTPRKVSALLSRPGKPFRILSINTDASFLQAKAEPSKSGDEYRLEVRYDGKAPEGDFASLVTVRTDDPQQPELKVTVRGVGER